MPMPSPPQAAIMPRGAGCSTQPAVSLCWLWLEWPPRGSGSEVPEAIAVARVCLVLLVAAVSGCAGSSSGDGEPPCFPPGFSVAPSSAKPGDSVTVEAPDADCNPRYGANARIQVTITDAAGLDVLTGDRPHERRRGLHLQF